ncbi:glycosyltransferase family protein [Natronococcus occultus]|uniref:Glycosyl transferase n=1 Tax=Natronococcus occultus SP4 TaxID=694430 RepID=L0K2E7_9EURY|nr:hypothetical protein [Natronococcus occultus]AGB38725.1 hypothetical protein Natoc_2970 [Natronococcus occultus SP4]
MYRDHTIGVVIPAQDEDGSIGDAIRELPDCIDAAFVVDDCSSDETWGEILNAARRDTGHSDRELARTGPIDPNEVKPDTGGAKDEQPEEREVRTDGGTSALARRADVHDPIGRMVPIEHRERRGIGGAITTGYLASLERDLDVTIVATDGLTERSLTERLLDPLVEDAADYATIGRSPIASSGEASRRHRVGSWTRRFLTKIASGYWKTRTPRSATTAISRGALVELDLEGLSERGGHRCDLLTALNVAGLRVADVVSRDVVASSRQWTSSGDASATLRTVLGNFRWRLQARHLVMDFHPLALFYLAGIGTTAFGLLIGAWALYAGGSETAFVPVAMSAVVFTIGVLFVLFAMVFDMRASERLELRRS